MKVLLSTIGSRGDVQPLVALALELRALGHEPSLCVPPNFKDWVESFDLRCIPIGPDVRRFTAPAASSGAAKAPAIRAGAVKLSRKQARALAASSVREQFRVLAEAARGCDLLVGATALQIAARSIAEALEIPYVFVAYCPTVLPAPDHPPVPKRGFVYPQWLPSIVNRVLWKMDDRSVDATFLATLNEERAKLGQAPVGSVQRHVFTDRPWLAADPALAPAPRRSRMRIVQTGAWVLPDESPLPEPLERFLADGEPPVYLGFGSMRAREQTGRLLVEAARAARVRAVLSQGWGDLGLVDAGVDVVSVGDVNHEKLFSRVAAVVHHGGSGTTAAAARAAKPQVIVPHNYDQFYFAWRVRELGVGASCVRRDRLTVDGLASALRECLRPQRSASAKSLASRMARDGAKIAAERLTREFATTGAGGGAMRRQADGKGRG
jgi:vancomycin aglycone glucosyltransferase